MIFEWIIKTYKSTSVYKRRSRGNETAFDTSHYLAAPADAATSIKHVLWFVAINLIGLMCEQAHFKRLIKWLDKTVTGNILNLWLTLSSFLWYTVRSYWNSRDLERDIITNSSSIASRVNAVNTTTIFTASPKVYTRSQWRIWRERRGGHVSLVLFLLPNLVLSCYLCVRQY